MITSAFYSLNEIMRIMNIMVDALKEEGWKPVASYYGGETVREYAKKDDMAIEVDIVLDPEQANVISRIGARIANMRKLEATDLLGIDAEGVEFYKKFRKTAGELKKEHIADVVWRTEDRYNRTFRKTIYIFIPLVRADLAIRLASEFPYTFYDHIMFVCMISRIYPDIYPMARRR